MKVGSQTIPAGQIVRTVAISQHDADVMNKRKVEYGFEYVPVELTVEIKKDESKKAEQGTMEIQKPKRGFPKKKQ